MEWVTLGFKSIVPGVELRVSPQTRPSAILKKKEKQLAEGAGFEPAVGFCLRTLSKRVPSTTQPPLRRRRSVAEQSIPGKDFQ